MRKALTILTKIPLAGKVKSRLTPKIDEKRAAELQKCFLLDTINLAMGVEDCDVVVAYTPENALDALKGSVNAPMKYISQKGSDLGERLYNVFYELFKEGYGPVVIIGTDSPTLPPKFIERAFEELKENDVVVGPAVDGGYYLIGLRHLNKGLFVNIEWGTERVLQQTMRIIKKERLKVGYLDVWYDIDTVEDVKFLAHHLDYLKCVEKGDVLLPRETEKMLRKMDLD